MATISTAHDGHRHGAVRQRSQFFNNRINRWVKRDTTNGRFLEVKSDNERFKGIRREKPR